MENFVEIHLKKEMLKRHQLPDIAYPLPPEDLVAALDGSGHLPFASILHGLQQRSRNGEADWLQLEPAMDRISEILAPEDHREVICGGGDDWWLEVGPVDLCGKLVTIQRHEELIAAIASLADGRLRVATFRPLDAKSANYLITLSRLPHPEHGVYMRENNWEYALDCSAGMGNFYAFTQGEAHLSYWANGLGIRDDGSEEPSWRQKLGLVARPAAKVLTELGVYYTLSESDE